MIDGFEMVIKQMEDMVLNDSTLLKYHRLNDLLRLYLVYPAPARKIRKCQRRKLQARWRKGRAYIEKRAKALRKRWEAA